MKNIMKKIIVLSPLWILAVCLSCSGAAPQVIVVQDQSCSHLNDVRKLGLFATNNVLLCEGRQYANWFFPIQELGGCNGFYDIAERKFGGLDMNPQNERQVLRRYLACLQRYLTEMEAFYPARGNWYREKVKAKEALDRFIDRLNAGANVRDVKNDLRKREKMLSIWNCVHTEPLCVFDHMNESNVIFSGNPVLMRSRFRPCSLTENNWNCKEMLEKVAEIIGCFIEFHYYR